MTTLAARLWSKVKKSDGCWVWTGASTGYGYGRLRCGRGRYVRAHRAAYEFAYGPIAGGVLVCHRCDNRLCCRPDHLFLGTHKDNSHDMVAKGRSASGGRHGRSKLTEEDVRQIRLLRDLSVKTRWLADTFAVSASLINLIQEKKVWRKSA